MRDSGNAVIRSANWSSSTHYGILPIPRGKCGNENTGIPVIFIMDFQGYVSTDRIVQFIKRFYYDPTTRRQVIQFCGVGILNTLIGYAAFYLLVNYLYYLLALLLSHIIGVLNSYLWNKFWVFKSRTFRVFEFIRFNIVYAFVFFANAAALFVSVDIIHADPRIAQLILLPVVTLVSFFGQKLWTFNDKIDT